MAERVKKRWGESQCLHPPTLLQRYSRSGIAVLCPPDILFGQFSSSRPIIVRRASAALPPLAAMILMARWFCRCGDRFSFLFLWRFFIFLSSFILSPPCPSSRDLPHDTLFLDINQYCGSTLLPSSPAATRFSGFLFSCRGYHTPAHPCAARLETRSFSKFSSHDYLV